MDLQASVVRRRSNLLTLECRQNSPKSLLHFIPHFMQESKGGYVGLDPLLPIFAWFLVGHQSQDELLKRGDGEVDEQVIFRLPADLLVCESLRPCGLAKRGVECIVMKMR